MRKRILGLAVAMAALMGVAHAEDKKVTIGVSIPAADHGWTAGVVFHAERMAKLLMAQHPGLNVIVKTSPDPATQANAVQDLVTQGINALVILPSDPDPLVNAIKEVKNKNIFVTLVDRAPSNNDNSVRDLSPAIIRHSAPRQVNTSRKTRRLLRSLSSAACRSRSTSSARTASTRRSPAPT
jgi:ribose transport system substrate-binding protein